MNERRGLQNVTRNWHFLPSIDATKPPNAVNWKHRLFARSSNCHGWRGRRRLQNVVRNMHVLQSPNKRALKMTLEMRLRLSSHLLQPATLTYRQMEPHNSQPRTTETHMVCRDTISVIWHVTRIIIQWGIFFNVVWWETNFLIWHVSRIIFQCAFFYKMVWRDTNSVIWHVTWFELLSNVKILHHGMTGNPFPETSVPAS